MKQRIRVKLSGELLAKLRKMAAQAPGLRWVPELPGQPTPQRPAETPDADPVSETLDQKLPRVGGA